MNINKSPIVASSWYRLHLLFKHARLPKHKISFLRLHIYGCILDWNLQFSGETPLCVQRNVIRSLVLNKHCKLYTMHI
jgi:hypothetical protein